MDKHLESMFARAKKLLGELKEEYTICLHSRTVSDEAKNLTHEVLEKLKNILDNTMSKFWIKYIAPNLSEEEREKVRPGFPIGNSFNALPSVLGNMNMLNLEKTHKDLYDFLLEKQPFSSEENRWLELLKVLSGKGKHFQLIPQKRIERVRSIEVTRRGGGTVIWHPKSVKYGEGVKILGAPIDSETQRIKPTPGITERIEVWVSFEFEGYGINALEFCIEACRKTHQLVEEMLNVCDIT